MVGIVVTVDEVVLVGTAVVGTVIEVVVDEAVVGTYLGTNGSFAWKVDNCSEYASRPVSEESGVWLPPERTAVVL